MEIRRRPPSPDVNVIGLRYQVVMPDTEPQNILEEIVWQKEIEVEQRREQCPLVDLQRKLQFAPPGRNFRAALQDSPTRPAVIAEVKKASPSRGVIREDFDPVAIAQSYEQAGATCLSVLTDEKYFQGSFENLAKIRGAVQIPLLCKEFIIYPYQIYQARISGADAVLLIAAILSDQDLQYFTKIITKLGMTPLVEVHTLEELGRVLALSNVNLIGINNRNLTDFSVDLQTTAHLLTDRQEVIATRNLLIVSESGLRGAADLKFVATAGARAVLIGESLIRQPDPGIALYQLIQDLIQG
ncbi:MAG: indole-3-glycerol phosphate synthase TrpC [Oscillatoriales cyanobacterium RM2_1_1]|nr:indole-3-glycerol phosphate synthase TrpC [Oscillatoriales cyanobacterium RM2_1_1]